MRWKILSVGYPLAQVSEDPVGGAEQVLSMLDRALLQAGHRSIVIAPSGSRVRGDLVSLPAIPGTIDQVAKNHVHGAAREAIADTLKSHEIDLIRMHGIDFADYLPDPGIPVLITLHLPLYWYPEEALQPTRPRTYLHCVSASQAGTAPLGVALLSPISNGTDFTRFRLKTRKQDYALLLGRICPEKGVDIALRACKAAGIPLLIGGQVYPYQAHEEYFRNVVTPLLDRCRRFLGPLALPRKIAFPAAARCLLILGLVPETSSLVAMEAMASGTPVIAFRSGALPEIIDEGCTGFLVDNEEGMSQAIRRTHEIDPAVCRQTAETRFSDRDTVQSYFAAYKSILSEKKSA
jgi:glycosyltransferase involved in cell wall biosynthesis